ncbi:MAG: ABC transporter ATP-binding protein [Nitrososphaeraceae archaeon]
MLNNDFAFEKLITNEGGVKMKIDVHAHTKKTKTGDAETRNVDKDSFSNIIRETDVKILAITNHNHFDLAQYNDFVNVSEGVCDIWPGIELDIMEDDRRGHLIVIVNPKESTDFDNKVKELVGSSSIENFSIDINSIVQEFSKFDAIYIPHYYTKKPALSDHDVEKLTKLVYNSNRVIKEATNSISAGVYISHGHKSIYGTDIHDWNKYIDEAKKLPELRLPIESFEHFCLLLDKDEPTINTMLNYKKQEEFILEPFQNDDTVNVSIFNDINILFGSKGTGKSDILEAIAKQYNDRGMSVRVYQSSGENLEERFDIKGNNLTFDIKELGINDCLNEIGSLGNLKDVDITNVSKYSNYFSTQVTNRKAKNLMVSRITSEDTISVSSTFDFAVKELKYINDFRGYIDKSDLLQSILDEDLKNQLTDVLRRVINVVDVEKEKRYIESESVKLLNQLIKVIGNEIAKKTGSPAKPGTTGFRNYARNRIKIECSINKILKSIETVIPNLIEGIGDLGNKGKLDCITEFVIQDGTISDSSLGTLSKVNKTPQKEFVLAAKSVYDKIYTNNLFEAITALNGINGIETIKSINDLILFKKYFAIKGVFYKPSNGESSMLLLHNELLEDKDIYLLDEPEKSLGNDYINDVIVPILKERAKMRKKVIIATHDANIAVRTLPYNSIYRVHDKEHYHTYVGNPFSNYLICNESGKKLDWKEISMKTLEGGKEAFGERGKIYGDYKG